MPETINEGVKADVIRGFRIFKGKDYFKIEFLSGEKENRYYIVELDFELFRKLKKEIENDW